MAQTTNMKKPVVNPIEPYTQGPYKFMVDTPDGGTFYFEDRELANEFIEFYVEYNKKKKVGKLLGD